MSGKLHFLINEITMEIKLKFSSKITVTLLEITFILILDLKSGVLLLTLLHYF